MARQLAGGPSSCYILSTAWRTAGLAVAYAYRPGGLPPDHAPLQWSE